MNYDEAQGLHININYYAQLALYIWKPKLTYNYEKIINSFMKITVLLLYKIDTTLVNKIKHIKFNFDFKT